MASSRYVVGIDLGTTNSALAYVDTGVGEGKDAVPTASDDSAGRAAGRRRGTAAVAVVSLSARAQRTAGRQPEAALGAGPRLRRRRVRPQLRQPGADAAGGLGQVVAVPSRRRSPAAGLAVEGAGECPPRLAAGSQHALSQASGRGVESPDRQGRGRRTAWNSRTSS